MHAKAALLFKEEIIIRLFPVLRRVRSLRGEPTRVGTTIRDDKRVLFGVIKFLSGYRFLKPYRNMRQDRFQDFLRVVRCCYLGKEIWMLLENSSAQTAQKASGWLKNCAFMLSGYPDNVRKSMPCVTSGGR